MITTQDLRKFDIDAEKIDRAHAIRKQYDDEWEIPQHNKFGEWKTIIEDHQDHLINPNLLTKPSIQAFLEYLPNPDNLGLSRFR